VTAEFDANVAARDADRDNGHLLAGEWRFCGDFLVEVDERVTAADSSVIEISTSPQERLVLTLTVPPQSCAHYSRFDGALTIYVRQPV